MSKTANKFTHEVCQPAGRLLLDYAREHLSHWAAITSIAAKIGCTGQALDECVIRLANVRLMHSDDTSPQFAN